MAQSFKKQQDVKLKSKITLPWASEAEPPSCSLARAPLGSLPSSGVLSMAPGLRTPPLGLEEDPGPLQLPDATRTSVTQEEAEGASWGGTLAQEPRCGNSLSLLAGYFSSFCERDPVSPATPHENTRGNVRASIWTPAERAPPSGRAWAHGAHSGLLCVATRGGAWPREDERKVMGRRP